MLSRTGNADHNVWQKKSTLQDVARIGQLYKDNGGDASKAISAFTINDPAAGKLAKHALMFYKKYGSEMLDSIKDYETTLAFACADARECEGVFFAMQLSKRAPKPRTISIG